MVIEQWQKYAKDDDLVPWTTLGQWQGKLQFFRDEMSQLNAMEDIIHKSQAYRTVTRAYDADVLNAASFLNIPAVVTGIPNQFDIAIMEPLEAMLERNGVTRNPTPHPTMYPTGPPKLCYSRMSSTAFTVQCQLHGSVESAVNLCRNVCSHCPTSIYLFFAWHRW